MLLLYLYDASFSVRLSYIISSLYFLLNFYPFWKNEEKHGFSKLSLFLILISEPETDISVARHTVDSSRQNANNLHYTKNIFSRPLLDQARKCVGDEHYYNMREPMVEISYLILLMNDQQ